MVCENEEVCRSHANTECRKYWMDTSRKCTVSMIAKPAVIKTATSSLHGLGKADRPGTAKYVVRINRQILWDFQSRHNLPNEPVKVSVVSAINNIAGPWRKNRTLKELSLRFTMIKIENFISIPNSETAVRHAGIIVKISPSFIFEITVSHGNVLL